MLLPFLYCTRLRNFSGGGGQDAFLTQLPSRANDGFNACQLSENIWRYELAYLRGKIIVVSYEPDEHLVIVVGLWIARYDILYFPGNRLHPGLELFTQEWA